MRVVRIVVQMRVMRSIVPTLYEGIVDGEPVIAVSVQRSVPPLLADVQTAASDKVSLNRTELAFRAGSRSTAVMSCGSQAA